MTLPASWRDSPLPPPGSPPAPLGAFQALRPAPYTPATRMPHLTLSLQLACGWHMAKVIESGTGEEVGDGDNWVKNYGFISETTSNGSKYLAALYWSIATLSTCGEILGPAGGHIPLVERGGSHS